MEALARLEAELLGEHTAALLVGVQRFRLTAGAVEREHELPARPLAERLLRDERFQLGDELVVSPQLEDGLDPLLPRGETELLEAGDLGLGEVLVPELGEGRPAPKREGLSQGFGGSLGLASRERAPPFVELGAERLCVELSGLHTKAIAVPVGLERAARRAEAGPKP